MVARDPLQEFALQFLQQSRGESAFCSPGVATVIPFRVGKGNDIEICVVIEREDEKQAGGGNFTLPSGEIDKGETTKDDETVIEAALREYEEEGWISAESDELFFIGVLIKRSRRDAGGLYPQYFFVYYSDGSVPMTKSDRHDPNETGRPVWVSLKDGIFKNSIGLHGAHHRGIIEGMYIVLDDFLLSRNGGHLLMKNLARERKLNSEVQDVLESARNLLSGPMRREKRMIQRPDSDLMAKLLYA